MYTGYHAPSNNSNLFIHSLAHRVLVGHQLKRMPGAAHNSSQRLTRVRQTCAGASAVVTCPVVGLSQWSFHGRLQTHEPPPLDPPSTRFQR